MIDSTETPAPANPVNAGNCVNPDNSALREELRQSEASRLEFLKYKLIAAATLAAVAFGIGSWRSTNPNLTPGYVLAVIPFVCLFVDALCYHNNLRILVIAKYLRCCGNSYEIFLDQWDQLLQNTSSTRVRQFFKMETWALDLSTRVLAILVVVAGLFSIPDRQGIYVALAGLLGLFASLFLKSQYNQLVERIGDCTCAQILNRAISGR